MEEVDEVFIQALEHRPKLSITEAEGVPLIDLSPLINSPNDNNNNPTTNNNTIDDLVLEIGNACKNWGFFQVINHGVPLDKRRRIENEARKFFGQPLEEKRKVRRRDEKKAEGYYEFEHTKNVRDWKEVFDFNVESPCLMPASHEPEDKEVVELYNQWPDYPVQLREACEGYAREVEKLSYKLMELIALSLGLPANRFNTFFNDQSSFIRLNHYTPCPFPHLALGVGRHKDGGALTVLAQDDVGGLEVKRKTDDGNWVRVKPTHDAYIINVGDIIQVWSNDAYESVEHRAVVNSEKERFSMAFFFNPSYDTMVKPLDELIADEQKYPAKYRAYSWGKFLTNRKLSNYKKLGVENLQIYHFKGNNRIYD